MSRLRKILLLIMTIIPLFFCLSCEKPEREAKVETGQVTKIMTTSAKVAGEIIDVGEGIEQYGHCWSLSTNPTIYDTKSELGSSEKAGDFTSDLNGLEAGKTYHVRAYAISNDIVYGKDQVFNTQDGKSILSITDIKDITLYSAKSGGNILSVNGDDILGRGVCWDTVTIFSLSNCLGYTTDSSGLGEFESEITGLIPKETYYIKAYAYSSVDTSYSEIISFSTLTGTATISTNEVTEIKTTTAVCGGNITNDGGAAITQRGICWSTTPNPTIADLKTNNDSGTGSYISNLSGLQADTIYFVRAYAINSVDTTYGTEKSFKTMDGIPVLTTTTANNITTTSAVSGGNITDDEGATITSRGVCWNSTGNPTLENSEGYTSDGSGTGSYTSQLTGLEVNTIYYLRGYAVTDYGAGYGNEVTFLTKGLPDVNTAEVIEITDTSAVCGGEVTSDWGYPVTARGICWNTIENPTLENNDGFTQDGASTGIFMSNLTGLTKGTTYYVRAYAMNSIGTSYGEEEIFETTKPFECGTSTITDYDGNVYNTVQIGDQCWMKENLKVTHYADGTAIPLVEGTTEWDALGYSDKAYCYYNDSISYKDNYGVLYTWAAAMNGVASSNSNPSGIQGACPVGWHLPSNAEWIQLTDFLGGESVAGGKMKETGTIHWGDPNTGATNESNFTALPGGYRGWNGTFISIGYDANFWSSTEGSSTSASYRGLRYMYSTVRPDLSYKQYGYSVRCLRD